MPQSEDVKGTYKVNDFVAMEEVEASSNFNCNLLAFLVPR